MNAKCCRVLLCLLFLMPLAVMAESIVPGSYSNYRFDPSIAGFQSVDFGITVKVDPGYRANTFWSNQFSLVGTGSGAYTGMQSDGGSDRIFLFSVWDATDAKPGSDGSYCQSFGGEGVGQSCRMAYEWKQGHTYRFHVAYEGDQWLGVTVTDLNTRFSFKLGSIRTASTQISPKGMVNWTEYFEWNAPDASCYDQPYSKAEFALPKGDSGVATASISSTSVKPGCSAFSDIVLTPNGSEHRNALGNTIRGPVQASKASWCMESKGGAASGVPAISNICSGDQSQSWVYASDHTLRLQNNLCLDISGSSKAVGAPVGVYTCTGGTNQRWTAMGAQLRSDWSGLCLAASSSGAQLTMQTCNFGAASQRWTLPEPSGFPRGP